MKKAISLLLVFLLAACVLGGCAKKDEPDYAAASTSHEAYVPEDSSTTDAPDEDFDANDLFRTLSGSWEQMSSSSPGGFPSVIHAGENGNLVLEEIVFQYNGQLMFPKELAGDWMIEKDQMPAILVYPDETSSTTLGIFVQDHSEHTLTLTNGDQSCTYVRKLDPDSTVSGVGSSDPQWGSIWGMISSRMEGSWSLINQDVADNYPAAMEIYSNGAPEIDVLWQGSSYYCHWYVDGSCFCIDINDSFDQLMYHVAVDENYLVMTRRLDENTVLMDSAYYYKVAAPDYGTEIEGEDPAAMETPSEIWEHDYQPGMENTRSVYTRPYKTRIDKLSPIVRQDQMLYFVSNGILRKMPVGGDITNVQGIYPFENAFRNPKEIQVLGDWVYVRYEYSAEVIQNQFRFYQQAVARISTDGYHQTELILCDMAANAENSSNTFMVCDNLIYYTYNLCVQTSATQFTFYSGLKQYDMTTGSEFIVYEQPVEKFDRGLEIAAYTEDTILVRVPTSSWGDAEYLLYDLNTGMMSGAPQIANHSDFYVDGNCYFAYYHDDDECHIYRYAPETGYAQEIFFSEEYGWSTDDPEWHYVLCADGAFYASTRKGIVAFRDGERYLLTPDPAVNIRWIGDGYIYYECNGGFYRVLPDGNGWEPVNWYIQ